MAILKNDEGNVLLEILILNNKYLDVEKGRSDYENWVPFSFQLTVDNEVYEYSAEKGGTFTLFEIKKFISDVNKIIEIKKRKIELELYTFSCSEAYFEISIYDTFEDDDLYIDFWLNIGILTDGAKYGYNKGVRFVARLADVEIFNDSLREQLKKI